MKYSRFLARKSCLLVAISALLVLCLGAGAVAATEYGTIEIGQNVSELNLPSGLWVNETYGSSFEVISRNSRQYVTPRYNGNEVVEGIYTRGDNTLTIVHPKNRIIVLENTTGISVGHSVHTYLAYYNASGNLSDENLTYRSDNSTAVSINSSKINNTYGYRDLELNGESLGSATIYAELESNTSVNVSLTFSVTEEIPTSALVYKYLDESHIWSKIDNNSPISFDVWETCTLKAEIYDQFGSMIDSVGEWRIGSGTENLFITQNATDNQVKLSPLKKGTATILFTSKTDGQIFFSAPVNINGADSIIIFITYCTLNLSLNGSTGSAVAAVYSTDGKHPDPNERLVWSVDNESVIEVIVKMNGNNPTHEVTIKPKSAGSARLTASYAYDPSVKRSVTITIDETVISSIEMGYSVNTSQLLSSSGAKTGHVSVFDQHGIIIPDVSVNITSGNSSILSVSNSKYGEYSSSVTLSSPSDYYIKPGIAGETTIIASCVDNPLINQTLTIRVNDPVASYLKIIKKFDGISNLSTEFTWAYIYTSDGETISTLDSELLWSVEDTNVVTLSDATGTYNTITPNASAIGKSTKIRAQYAKNSSIYDEFTITVTEAIPSSLVITGPTELTTEQSSNNWVRVYVHDQYDEEITTDEISWSVDNESVLTLDPGTVYGRSVKVIPRSAGIATVTATAVSNSSVHASQKITVLESVPTSMGVFAPSGISLSGSGVLVISVTDQKKYSMNLTALSQEQRLKVSVSNESVIQISERTSLKSGDKDRTKYYLITPISKGTGVINITCDSLKVRVEIPVVEDTPTAIEAGWSGSDTENGNGYILMGSHGTASARVFNQFMYPYGANVRWVVDDTSILNVSSVISASGSQISLLPQSPGRTTLRAMVASDESIFVSFPVYVYEEIPTKFPVSIVQGENITVSGESDADKMQYYLFGTNYFDFGTFDVINGTYCYNITGTSAMKTGMHYAILQNPGVNGVFNITVDGTSIYLTNGSGKSLLFDAKKCDREEALERMIQAFESGSVDDRYEDYGLFVMPPNEKQVYIVEPPAISSTNDQNGLFADSTSVSITTGTSNATIYYTVNGTEPTRASIKYTAPFIITENTVVKAFAVRDNYEDSPVSSVVFTNINASPQIYKVTVNSAAGGNITASPASGTLDAVPYGTIVTIAATPDDGYKFTRWSTIGVQTGTVKEKSPSVLNFSMGSEDVNISAVFTQVTDPTPKASVVKITNTPDIVYQTDTGVLNAISYDQYGAVFSTDKVTWKSSAKNIITIDAASGAYKAIACGYATITATSTENPAVSATYIMTVYQPPLPNITVTSAPSTAYYGTASDAFNITSTDTTYLKWNWADGSSAVKMQVNTPFPTGSQSFDAVTHTFRQTGNLLVTVTPSNKYGDGTPETFPVAVTYAPPRNVKITDGPSSVIAGDTATYSVYATGADGYLWYLDDVLQASSAIPIPVNMSGEHTVKVTAYKDTPANNASATKIIHVSAPAGTLGTFGNNLTKTPEYSVIGELSVFSIDAVANATTYSWTFGADVINTTVPSVSYVLNDSLNTVNVTAYNSAGTASAPKVYSFTPAGNKPHVTGLTASPAGSAPAGTQVTYTATATNATTYKWVVDGKTVSGATGSSYTRTWTDLDVKRHEIAVYAINIYGEDCFPITYTVTPRASSPAVIEAINGPSMLSSDLEATYAAVVISPDSYTCAWYVDNVLQTGENSENLTRSFAIGVHTVKLVVVTSAEEVTTMEKTVVVVSRSDWDASHSVPDQVRSAPAKSMQMPLKADGNSGGGAIHTVGSIALGKDDISEDALYVNMSITPLNDEDLTGFASDMGSTSDTVMQISISPNGLKNEKDLKEAALLTFRIPKSSITNSESVKFFRYDTGTEDGIDAWVELEIEGTPVSEGDYWVFTVKTSGFSDFVGVAASYAELVAPSSASPGSSSSGSSKPDQSSVLLKDNPVTQDTVTPVNDQNPAAVSDSPQESPALPSSSPSKQQTQKSPVPFVGLIAGLGAVALLLRARK